MARQLLTGVPELEATLKGLADKAADRVARSAIGGGLTVAAKRIRQAAPKGKTGALKKSIRSRFERRKGNRPPTAKVGVNVGKQKKTAEGMVKQIRAPHAHLVALGTRPRKRKQLGGKFATITQPTEQQLSTGTMPANPFVKKAFEAARPETMKRMAERAAKALEREAAKARKTKG